MMKINLVKKLSLLGLSSILLCSSLIGLTSPVQAQEYASIPLDSFNHSGAPYSSSSEQISVGQRPYATATKTYLSSSYSYNSSSKITTLINKENNSPRVTKLAIPDGSDLVKVRITLFINGVWKGSKIMSRGQVFKFVVNPKFADDYTIIWEAVQGEGNLYSIY